MFNLNQNEIKAVSGGSVAQAVVGFGVFMAGVYLGSYLAELENMEKIKKLKYKAVPRKDVNQCLEKKLNMALAESGSFSYAEADEMADECVNYLFAEVCER